MNAGKPLGNDGEVSEEERRVECGVPARIIKQVKPQEEEEGGMRRVVCTMPTPLMVPNVVEFGHIWVHSSVPAEQ